MNVVPQELVVRHSVAGESASSVQFEEWCERPCKPDPVPSPEGAGDSHFSGTDVAARLERPTRKALDESHRHESFPIWPFSGWGLPSHPRLRGCWCALTAPFHPCRSPGEPDEVGGLLSVALSLASRPVAVSNHPGPRSPDFPPRDRSRGTSTERLSQPLAPRGIIAHPLAPRMARALPWRSTTTSS